ncbi:hypothetical protein DFH06DRAFT_1127911 [Mycena polygramma]|nr:hypothetical protein DFH06DRAFT_1127911 [Mycena polygramma]
MQDTMIQQAIAQDTNLQERYLKLHDISLGCLKTARHRPCEMMKSASDAGLTKEIHPEKQYCSCGDTDLIHYHSFKVIHGLLVDSWNRNRGNPEQCCVAKYVVTPSPLNLQAEKVFGPVFTNNRLEFGLHWTVESLVEPEQFLPIIDSGRIKTAAQCELVGTQSTTERVLGTQRRKLEWYWSCAQALQCEINDQWGRPKRCYDLEMVQKGNGLCRSSALPAL